MLIFAGYLKKGIICLFTAWPGFYRDDCTMEKNSGDFTTVQSSLILSGSIFAWVQ
jgi:hypothetical protein